MWISRQMAAEAERPERGKTGKVTSARNAKVIVQGDGEYRDLQLAAPWGIEGIPPEGAKVLVLTGSGVCLGAVLEESRVQPGELKLFSSGGAEIYLKNNGDVVINGQIFAKQGE